MSRQQSRPSQSLEPPEPLEPLHPASPEEAIAEAELPQAPEDLPVSWRGALDRWLLAGAPALTYLAVGAGGIVGANARYFVGVWAVAWWGSAFPWGTLLINLAGSLLLGWYLTRITERVPDRPTERLFVATGFCGGFTTYSTFSYEAYALWAAGKGWAALAYVVTSVVLGLGAAWAGVRLARLRPMR